MPVMITSSPRRPLSSTALPAVFKGSVRTFFSRLGRAIWCDVSRARPGSPVTRRLRGFAVSPAMGAEKSMRNKKGARDPCPSLLGCGRGTPPPRTHLTQRRYDDNILDGIIHRDFSFAPARRELAAAVVSRHPDLGQEILVTVVVEDQLGLFRHLVRLAGVRQRDLGQLKVTTLDHHGPGGRAHALDSVFSRGKLGL